MTCQTDDGGVAKYTAYIHSIREIIVKYADVPMILVIGEFSSALAEMQV